MKRLIEHLKGDRITHKWFPLVFYCCAITPIVCLTVLFFQVDTIVAQQFMPNRRKAFQPVSSSYTAFYPTNIANKSYTFWTAENYETNTGIAKITELMGTGFIMDAPEAAAPWRKSSVLNGYPVLGFSSAGVGNPIKSGQYKTINTAHEIMMVLSYTNGTGYVFGGTNATYWHAVRLVDTVPRIDVWVGTDQREFQGGFPTSTYFVLSALFLTGTNALYTNGVLFGSITYGNGTVRNDGAVLGVRYDGGVPSAMSFVALATYTNMLSATERTDAVTAFRTRYGF